MEYSARSVEGAAIVVAGFEVGVVVAALELEAGFQNFRGDVDYGGCEITEKAWKLWSDLRQDGAFMSNLPAERYAR